MFTGTSSATESTSGAIAWVRALQRAQVDCVFAYPGATALPLFDALATHAPEIRIVLPRHEQGATFMASGYARASGRPGVVLVTSGPGATNTVTAIADAWMDSIPLLVFSAQVALPLIGTDAFQESDITGITLPITKHSYLLKSADDLPFVVDKSFYLATTGRQGPVVIDIPFDVAQAPLVEKAPPVALSGAQSAESNSSEARAGEAGNLASNTQGRSPEECVQTLQAMPRGYDPSPQADPADIARVAELLAAAKRPLIIAGGGVIAADASAELEQLARSRATEVMTTMMGRGAFPEDDPLWLGMAGRFGGLCVCESLEVADLVLALGTRLTERVIPDWSKVAPKAQLIHVDIDAAELEKRHPTALAIHANLKDVLCLLLNI